MNVAKYLNDGWFPTDNCTTFVLYIAMEKAIDVDSLDRANCLDIFFRTEELAYRAIAILGEDTIKAALNNNY